MKITNNHFNLKLILGHITPKIIPSKFIELCMAKTRKIALRIPRYY